jgi:hypothetical protein
MICYHGSQPQEGSHNNQPSEKAEASESKLDRYSFYYVGRNQALPSVVAAAETGHLSDSSGFSAAL